MSSLSNCIVAAVAALFSAAIFVSASVVPAMSQGASLIA